MMKAVGGYFALELKKYYKGFYLDLIHLNTGRNSFEYILRVRKYRKVFIPYFTCDVLLEPLRKLEIDYEFYDVDNQLEAIFDFQSLKTDEGFLVTNYFGIKAEYIKKIRVSVKNLIVDNAQALFSEPELNVDTFYSPRKFIGIPDGGLVSIDTKLKEKLELDRSYGRFSHLIKRIDLSAEEGYKDFRENDDELKNLPIREMSKLTRELLLSIDFEKIKNTRRQNFQFLHEALKYKNKIKINLKIDDVPMAYPFRIQNAEELKQKLISEKIYCATYWPNVLGWCTINRNSFHLTREIIALPIDQRSTYTDLERIIKLINE